MKLRAGSASQESLNSTELLWPNLLIYLFSAAAMNTDLRILRFLKRASMRGRISFRPLAALSFFAASCLSANANITITLTFDSSITSDPNAATIEAGIDQAISRFETSIITPINVNIDFKEMSSGLGASSTFLNFLSYSQYRSDLVANQTSANDATALASLPVQTNNPVTGAPNMDLTLPDLRAVGETALGNNGGGFDSTISLNTSIMNLSRTGTQNPTFFDLQAIASHEIDEAFGIGGTGSVIGQVIPGNPAGSMDLFRYSANGVRSFTTSSSATAFFSINGGATNLTNFNQAGGGSDFGDWKGVPGSPQVQDAFSTPGVDINLGLNELTALDVVGYNLATVPEPGSGTLLLVGGLIAVGILRCRRKVSEQGGWAHR
jgi:hypothetical protein